MHQLVDQSASCPAVQNMVRVERRVMKKLFWSHDPVMSSVYASEEWVVHLRSTVAVALERAVAPADDYLATLEPFVEFLNVDGEYPNDFGIEQDVCRHVCCGVERNVCRHVCCGIEQDVC